MSARITSSATRALAALLACIVANMSLIPLIPTPVAEAAASVTCNLPENTEVLNTNPEEDPGDAPTLPMINEDDLSRDPLSLKNTDPDLYQAEIKQFATTNKGTFNSTTRTWTFCSDQDMASFLNVLSLGQPETAYLNTFSFPTNKIIFKNPVDRYAVTGELCTKFNGSVCDETKDGSGNPLYYDDSIWENGAWDAPKADARVLQTLIYLVTPVEQGGAGRERITVAKIIQPTDRNKEFNGLKAPSSTAAGEIQADEDAHITDTPATDSAHAYDTKNPSRPSFVSKALDISEIDNLRITTKIVQRKRLGGSSTSYQYNTVPLKVSYQTDEGAATAPLVPTTVYSGALTNFSLGLAGLLDDLDLQATFDVSDTNLSSLGDIAALIGQSLVTQLLTAPNGSLKGWDVASLLENVGRAYLAQQLGLAPNALASGTTVSDLIESVGRATVENSFNFPKQSLIGDTSDEVLINLGTRTMEDVFQITPGTLTARQYTSRELIEAVGAGRIEQRFQLQPGSVAKTNDWNELTKTLKFKLTFTKDASTFVDEALGLGFVDAGGGKNSYGFSEGDIEDATAKLLDNGNPSAAAVAKYKQLVGSRAIESGIGRFAGTGPDTGIIDTNPASHPFIQEIPSILGLKVFTGNKSSDRLQLDPGYTALYRDPNPVSGRGVTWNDAAKHFAQVSGYPEETMVALAQRLLEATLSNQFGTPNCNGLTVGYKSCELLETDKVFENHNSITTYWRPFFQQAFTNVSIAVSRIPNIDLPDRRDDQRSQEAASSILGLIKSYDDGLLTYIDGLGQSGRSAALGLPGSFYETSADGTIANIRIQNTDPANAMLDGNFTPDLMRLVGKAMAAKQMSSDLAAQHTLVALLKEDTSSITNTIAKLDRLTGSLGVDTSKWSDKGVQPDDIGRIFINNLGRQAFKRIGEQELLRTAWHTSGLQAGVDDTLKNANGAFSEVINTANTIADSLDFYVPRIQELQKLSREISDGSPDEDPGVASALPLLRTFADSGAIKSIADARSGSSKVEAIIRTIDKNTLPSTTKTKILRAYQLTREITSGHSLNLATAKAEKPSTTKQSVESRCFAYGGLRTLLGNPAASISTFAQESAGCLLDSNLNLPTGSMGSWLDSKDYSYSGLTVAVGTAYGKQTDKAYTNSEARVEGERILKAYAVSALGGLIPGYGNLGLTGESVFDLLTGNTTKVATSIGGSVIDSHLNWKPGTASTIISPTCTDTTGKLRACSSAETNNLRLQNMATVGLDSLGVNLNFPSTFSIVPPVGSAVGKYGVTTAYGIARISENLGIKPNTFYGTFANLRSLNSDNPQALAKAFGWYPSKPLQKLSELSQDLNQAGLGDVTTTSITATLNTSANAFLDALSDPSSGIWMVDKRTTLANSLATSDSTAYTASLKEIQRRLSTTPLANSLINPLLNRVTKLLAAGGSLWESIGALASLGLMLDGAASRAASLDTSFNVPTGSFKAFYTTGTDASKLADQTGTSELAASLEDAALRKALDGGPLEKLYDTFKVLTNECRLTDFFLTTGGVCKGAGIHDISLNDLRDNQSAEATLKRAALYDNLLGRAWGMQLEKNLKLQKGTIREIALHPWRSKEIAVDQGVRFVASQVFQIPDGQTDTDTNRTYVRALHNAFIAGFCGVDPLEDEEAKNTSQPCRINFSTLRATNNLRTSLNQTIEADFNTTKDSRKLTVTDMYLIGSGSMNGIYYVGAQKLAETLNTSLDTKDPRSKGFKIEFSDIRNAFGQFSFTQQDWDSYATHLQAETIRENLTSYTSETEDDCSASIVANWCTLSDSDLVKQYASSQDPALGTPEQRQAELASIADSAGTSGASYLRKQALSRLQYKTYDIAAYKLDPNIPVGFSAAMIQGTSAERSKMLGLYVLNTLNFSKDVLGAAGMTNEQIVDLADKAVSGRWQEADLNSLALLDNWLEKEGQSLLGINLPAGTVQGIFAWGANGFSKDSFDTSAKTTINGREFSPLGTVLREWGINTLMSWSDKALGFQAGATFQIYQSINQVIKAQKLVSLAQSAQLQGLVKFGGGDPTKLTTQAKANLAAAQAALISTVINLVFSGAVSSAEEAIGLVPGTGSLAVTMLVQLAMGVPVDPVTLGLFIAINLFGVYRVDIYQKATADGYYPFTGAYGVTRVKPLETISPEGLTTEFDAKNTTAYQGGIRDAARLKVKGLLTDLLTMPERWAPVVNVPTNALWISQMFTGRQEDVDDLDYLVSQPAPWDNPAGTGYGKLESRTRATRDAQTGKIVLQPLPGFRSGVFANSAFNSHLHIRW